MAEQERRLRWARRDNSLHPLTDVEKAERRHYSMHGLWMWIFLLGPVVASAALDIVFGAALLTPLLVGIAMLSGWFCTVIGYAFASWILPYVADSVRFWMMTIGTWIAAGGIAIVIFPVAIQNGEYFRLALPTLLTAVLLPFWPFVWRRLRWSRRSDYERQLDEANTSASGIIE
jgi:hypothetical protein